MLLSNGHTEARHYPLCVVAEEASIIRRRENNGYKTTAWLTLQAISANLGEEGFEVFKNTVNRLK